MIYKYCDKGTYGGVSRQSDQQLGSVGGSPLFCNRDNVAELLSVLSPGQLTSKCPSPAGDERQTPVWWGSKTRTVNYRCDSQVRMCVASVAPVVPSRGRMAALRPQNGSDQTTRSKRLSYQNTFKRVLSSTQTLRFAGSSDDWAKSPLWADRPLSLGAQSRLESCSRV